MATVEESLCLPDLQDVSVRAGREGLIRKIRWMHVIDTDDVGHFLEGQELLLTCGQIWPKDQGQEERLLQSFVDDQISGIIFATGHYIMGCPSTALEYGDQYDIPILEMPFEIPFVKVTQAVNQTILNSQYQDAELINQVPPMLAQKLKLAKGYKEACDILAAHFKGPIIITSPNKQMITKAIPSGHQHLNLPQLIDKLTEQFRNQTSKKEMTQLDKRVFRIPNPTFLCTMAVSLQSGNENWGILWLLRSDQEEALQAKILMYAATILLDLYTHQREAEIKCKRIQSELLELLIDRPDIAPKLVPKKMIELGLETNGKWIIGLVSSTGRSTASINIESLHRICKSGMDNIQGINGFCQLFEQQWVLFISTELEDEHLKKELGELYDYLRRASNTTLSLIFGEVKSEWTSIGKSYSEAQSLASFVRNEDVKDKIYFADELRRELILYGRFNQQKAEELRSTILPETFFSKKGELFFETLKCLAINDFNRERVAEALHIHPNTLRYRIGRIEELMECSLSSFRCRFWIQVALDLERFI